MVIFHSGIEATAARVTMEGVVATDSAYAAFVTVEDFKLDAHIIVQGALRAVVLRERFIT